MTTETKMTRAEAIKALAALQYSRLGDVYDKMTDEQSAAVLVLRPNFEYPNWDYRRVGALWA